MSKKRSTAKHPQISAVMHYSIFIALIVSLITTFLLGILLTETLFNGGLNYFSEVTKEGSVHGAAAAGQYQNSALIFSNQLKNVRTVGNDTYYDFTVSAKNTGQFSIKKLVFSYSYDPSVFEYITPGTGSVSQAVENTKKNSGNFLIPTAHAQVSIDFPLPTDSLRYTCILDTATDPALCDLSSGGKILKRGETWTTNLTFRLREPFAKGPSLFHRFFSWLFGLNAKAQVSIDFPTFFVTETTATVVEAITVNNQPITDSVSASASVTIPL